MKREYREEEALKCIKRFMCQNGYTPSIREIGQMMNLSSASSVHMYFSRLIERGDIIQHPDGKRYSVRGMKYVEDV